MKTYRKGEQHSRCTQESKAKSSTASVSRSILSTHATISSSMSPSTKQPHVADAHSLWQAPVVARLRRRRTRSIALLTRKLRTRDERIQIEKTNHYFNLNGVVPDCPYCSMHGWDGGEIISAIVLDEQGNGRPESVPMAQFSCRNGGHTSLFDARRVGRLSGLEA